MNKVFSLDQMQVAILLLLLLGVVIIVGFFHKEGYFFQFVFKCQGKKMVTRVCLLVRRQWRLQG